MAPIYIETTMEKKLYRSKIDKKLCGVCGGIAEYLEGPTAIAISREDCTAPARIIANNAKEVEALKFKASWIEGSIYDAEGTKQIANIPSKEVLIAKVLGGFNAPITSLAYVLKAIAEKQEA